MYDVIGVGFGPANIALAVALEELWPTARTKFLEKAPGPCWQPNMLIDGADIQNNPLRDLVTPRNPRSRYTFVNYLYEQGRLFKHLNLPSHFPLRKEYAQYVKWVAEQVSADVDYGREVAEIALGTAATAGGARPVEVTTLDGEVYRARSIVVAPGRSPYVPPVLAGLPGPLVAHTSQYLPALADLPAAFSGTIAVVGAGQSAVEVVLDLSDRFPRARVVNVMSGFGYRLKDTSPFSEEVYFPEFVDYYFHAPQEGKDRLREQLRPTNHSAADQDVINALYLRMYEDELDGRQRISLRTNRSITAAQVVGDDAVALELAEHITGEQERLVVDRVLLATGYRELGVGDRCEQLPPVLSKLAGVLGVTDRRPLSVGRDYAVATDGAAVGMPPVYINGLCESTHGLGDAGTFSLVAVRSKTIVQSLRQRLRRSALFAPNLDLVEPTPCADLVGAALPALAARHGSAVN